MLHDRAPQTAWIKVLKSTSETPGPESWNASKSSLSNHNSGPLAMQ
jgi:hypothetical protein